MKIIVNRFNSMKRICMESCIRVGLHVKSFAALAKEEYDYIDLSKTRIHRM